MNMTQQMKTESAEAAAQQNGDADLLQIQALLIARSYLYTLFHKVMGGTPDATLIEALTSPTTRDVLEEYAEAAPAIAELLGKLEALAGEDAASVADRAADEYTRVFIGPAALPSSPYEAPYKGTHDIALFQPNTLEVRAWYRDRGLQPRRVQAIPDDHVSLMCNFMAHRAETAPALFEAGRFDELGRELADERTFADTHLGSWIAEFAANVDTSAAGRDHVLYADALRALAGFCTADVAFLTEAAYWCETEASAEAAASIDPAAFAEVRAALDGVRALVPFGIADFDLVATAQ